MKKYQCTKPIIEENFYCSKCHRPFERFLDREPTRCAICKRADWSAQIRHQPANNHMEGKDIVDEYGDF